MRDFHLPGRSPVLAANGMIATSHPLAAAEGLSILKSGGNAVDAALAAAVLLGVCEPQMTGIGGDLFALVKPAGTDRIEALNGSGRAPAGLDPERLRDDGAEKIVSGTPASITIPGAVDAVCQLADRHGRLGLDRILAPAIRYFEEGVPIAPRVAFDLAGITTGTNDAFAAHYLKDGRPFGTGETFALPGQATVLRRIANEGARAFYEGDIADDMLAAAAAIGGTHTAADFAATAADWGTPVSGPYRDLELVEHPPNGQGATAILLAGILSHFDMAALDPNGAHRIHIHAEATKLAYAARNRILADPDHTARLDWMLSPDTAASLAGQIDMARASDGPTALREAFHRDTVYVAVVDRDGMAASLIYSIFDTFGAKVASPKYGILLHNRGSGFTLEKGHPNEAGPGKRPMHTIIPGMTRKDGTFDMTFGVMGGQYQASGHGHMLVNLCDHGMDPQAAIDAPRHFAIDGRLDLERGIGDDVAQALADKGHKVTRPSGPIGGAQAIRRDRTLGCLVGGSDPRKDGCALGY